MNKNFLLMSMLLSKNRNICRQANDMEYYIVQPGDSLWRIANKFNISLSDLIAANPQIENPYLIFPNQRINIPRGNIEVPVGLEIQVVGLINAERTLRDLNPLEVNSQLMDVARTKSEDMYKNNYFDHYSPTYGSPFEMLKKFGISFSSAAENIAKGQRTAESVFNAWMNSTGHRNNILNPDFTETGVGLADAAGTPIWTQFFIRP